MKPKFDPTKGGANMKLNDHDMQLYKQIVMGAFLLGIIVGMALVAILVF